MRSSVRDIPTRFATGACVPSATFLKALAAFEIATGMALLAPAISSRVAGASLPTNGTS
jgi:hypothetical protein